MIAIIGAMQIEIEAIKQHMSDVKEQVLFELPVWEGKIHNKEVVLALSGVGKVNAAMTTTILATQYDLEVVINIGTAGGLLEEQQVFDIVVADKVVQHDFDTSGLDGDAGHGLLSFSDSSLVAKAQTIIQSMKHRVWVGMIASGDTFVHEHSQIARINQYFPDCIACEMEAGAILAVCNRLEIQCIVIRSLSDNTHHEESPMDFYTYAKQASETSAVFCSQMVSELA